MFHTAIVEIDAVVEVLYAHQEFFFLGVFVWFVEHWYIC
jgi:hypothetical protein